MALVDCPSCGTPIGPVANWSDDPEKAKFKPEPGSVSMCFQCFELLIFNPDMTMRPLTTNEYKQINVAMRGELGRLRDKILRASRKK
jgi:hypothetical protein